MVCIIVVGNVNIVIGGVVIGIVVVFIDGNFLEVKFVGFGNVNGVMLGYMLGIG